MNSSLLLLIFKIKFNDDDIKLLRMIYTLLKRFKRRYSCKFTNNILKITFTLKRLMLNISYFNS